jgi:hypothetical protein
MATTLAIDDAIAKALNGLAERSNSPFDEVVNQTLRASQDAHPSASRPYRVKPAALGGVVPGNDLDEALALADALEDREIAARSELCALS